MNYQTQKLWIHIVYMISYLIDCGNDRADEVNKRFQRKLEDKFQKIRRKKAFQGSQGIVVGYNKSMDTLIGELLMSQGIQESELKGNRAMRRAAKKNKRNKSIEVR